MSQELIAQLRQTAEELIEPPTGNLGGVRIDAAKLMRRAAEALTRTPSTPTEEMIEARANDVTVALIEVMLEELPLDEDADLAGLERWGERADKLTAAAIKAMCAAEPC